MKKLKILGVIFVSIFLIGFFAPMAQAGFWPGDDTYSSTKSATVTVYTGSFEGTKTGTYNGYSDDYYVDVTVEGEWTGSATRSAISYTSQSDADNKAYTAAYEAALAIAQASADADASAQAQTIANDLAHEDWVWAAGSSETEDFSGEGHHASGTSIAFVDDSDGYYYPNDFATAWIQDGPYGSHSKVLQLYDDTDDGKAWLEHYFDHILVDGTIEFSVRLEQSPSNNQHYMYFRAADGTVAFRFRFNLKTLTIEYTTDCGVSYDVLAAVSDGVWYKIKIEIGIYYDVRRYSISVADETTGDYACKSLKGVQYDNQVKIEKVYIGTHVAYKDGCTMFDNFTFTNDPHANLDNDRSLIFLHGYGHKRSAYDYFKYPLNLDGNGYRPLYDYYGEDDIFYPDYYEHFDEEPEFNLVTVSTPIEIIAFRLYLYIKNHCSLPEDDPEHMKSNIDIAAHSMGGLVTRAMIKLFYPLLRAEGITIHNVALMGTPNYGNTLASKNILMWIPGLKYIVGLVGAVFDVWGYQLDQMKMGSLFLNFVNSPGDTPFSISDFGPYNTIHYSTYATKYNTILGVDTDGTVDTAGIPLHGNDVNNYYYTKSEVGSHTRYYKKEISLNDITRELTGVDATNYFDGDLIFDDESITWLEDGDDYEVIVDNIDYRYRNNVKVNVLGQNPVVMTQVGSQYISTITINKGDVITYYFTGEDQYGNVFGTKQFYYARSEPAMTTHYDFNEDEDDIFLRDISETEGYDNNMTKSDSIVTSGGLKPESYDTNNHDWGNGAYFDGTTNSYIEKEGFTMSTDDPEFYQDICIQFWVHSTSSPSARTYLTYLDDAGNEVIRICQASYADGGNLEVYINGYRAHNLNFNLAGEGWMMVTLSYSESHDESWLYVNNGDINHCGCGGHCFGRIAPTGTLVLGQYKDENGYSDSYCGYMDDLIISNAFMDLVDVGISYYNYLNPETPQTEYED